jgi:glycerol uptake facilitator-like aquaporin
VTVSLPRRLAAEALGTGLLLAVVIGSGIMGERLANGNAAIALLANAIATGCGLAVLIAVFASVSGAHFNPCVSVSMAWRRQLPWRDVLPYVAVQILACGRGSRRRRGSSRRTSPRRIGSRLRPRSPIRP